MNDAVNIYRIDTFRADGAAGTIAGIWGEATGVSEEEAQAFAIGTYPKHVRWPDFRLFMAAIDDNPIGFVYGYRSMPGQWWHDQVRASLIAARYEHWVDHCLELAEIAVLPQFQRRGIGGRLLSAFLEDIDDPVLLALEAADTRTHMLYASHGFQDLLTNFRYSGWDERIIVMGRASQGEDS